MTTKPDRTDLEDRTEDEISTNSQMHTFWRAWLRVLTPDDLHDAFRIAFVAAFLAWMLVAVFGAIVLIFWLSSRPV